ncbi:hypothetical protein [Pandoraea terrigena]|uniref:Tail fiber protein n=1 Tax=Pandoraea terrigena TaxID=2508292 RepID=A0A5E4V817_9BURK|nr:hypothetical protein [Pandoraea terrigena]VVE07704.1 Tail fiber protein [Pandoraea terrigena]
MKATDIPVSKLPLAFAANGAKQVIPEASQIGIVDGRASLNDGFPPLTRMPIPAGGVPPFGTDANGILFMISAWTRWMNAGGQVAFDAAFAADANVNGYPQGAVLARADGMGFWLCLSDNNTSNPDSSGATGWAPLESYGIAQVGGLATGIVTLTPAQYGLPIITLAGTLTGNVQLVFPATKNQWQVINNTTGNFSVTAKTAGGSGVIVQQGGAANVYGDGVNISLPPALQVGTATQPQHAAQLSQLVGVQGGFKNLKIIAQGVNNASAVVTVDELMLETSANAFTTVRSVNVTINSSGTVGQPNSLSAGALAASTWYYVWVWYNGTTVCGTVDPSATAPTAPAGFTGGYRARVGAVRTDSTGNKYLLQTLQYGRKAQYIANTTAGSNVPYLPAMASLVTGNPDAPTYTPLAVGSFVPPTASEIDLVMKAGSTSGHSICAPNGSYGSATSTLGTPPMVICVSGYGPAPIVVRALMTLESMNIYYANNDTTYGLLCCAGWVDNL